MPAFLAVSQGYPLNSYIIGFGASSSKENFFGFRPNQRRHLLPGVIQSLSGLAAFPVHTGRITPVFPHRLDHCLYHFLAHWRCPAMIQIYPAHPINLRYEFS
jgi:hypothetical protein